MKRYFPPPILLVTLAACLCLCIAPLPADAQTVVIFHTDNCPAYDVLIADLNREYEPVNGDHKASDYFVRRECRPGMTCPTIATYSKAGRLVHVHIGYPHTKPEKLRVFELRAIVERHPKFNHSAPPPAPPVTESVASRSAPVRTTELRIIQSDGTVSNPESLVPRTLAELVKPTQYAVYAGGDCSGSQSQAFATPYSDCGGGGIGGGVGGGGGDFYEPGAQSAFLAPQYGLQYAAPQYGLSYAQPYLQRYVPQQYQPQRYVVRYATPPYSPQATMPRLAQGGINNFALVSIQPQLGLGTLFGGGLGSIFGQRAYYAPRRVPYRTAAYSPFASYGMTPYRTASPFSFASYRNPFNYAAYRSPYSPASYGSSVVCGPQGCVVY